jgi:hypothetical protein
MEEDTVMSVESKGERAQSEQVSGKLEERQVKVAVIPPRGIYPIASLKSEQGSAELKRVSEGLDERHVGIQIASTAEENSPKSLELRWETAELRNLQHQEKRDRKGRASYQHYSTDENTPRTTQRPTRMSGKLTEISRNRRLLENPVLDLRSLDNKDSDSLSDASNTGDTWLGVPDPIINYSNIKNAISFMPNKWFYGLPLEEKTKLEIWKMSPNSLL